MTIRWARLDEGLVIRTLMRLQSLVVEPMIDWTQPLGPFWLLALTTQPIGCVMVNPGTPIGRVDMLVVRRDVSKKTQALAVKCLCYAAQSVLKSQGTQVILSGCAIDNPRWKQVMQRRGFVFTEPYEVGVKRI